MTFVASSRLAPASPDPSGVGAAEGAGVAVLEAGAQSWVVSLTLQLEQRKH